MKPCLAVFVGLALVGTMSAMAGGGAADAVAGKAKADQTCAACHDPGDWKGQSQAQLQAKISNVVAGKTAHKKKIQLSEQEIDDIAAYWSTAAPSAPQGK